MEFTRYRSMVSAAHNPRRVKYPEYYRELVTTAMRGSPKQRELRFLALLEVTWWDTLRAYYNLYPSLAAALLRVRLDVPCTSLLQLPTTPLSLRFSRERPLLFHPASGLPLRSLALWLTEISTFYKRGMQAMGLGAPSDAAVAPMLVGIPHTHSLVVAIQYGDTQPPDYSQMMLPIPPEECTIEQAIRSATGRHIPAGQLSQPRPLQDPEVQAVDNIFRLCLAVSLLPRDDGTLITPDVLNDDRAKLGQGRDDELHQKAVRRRGGEIGWDVGREIWEKRDISPHYRNPHLAHFWVGEGRTRCVLKLRAGAVVKRHLLRQVPTGYESLEEANGSHASDGK